jgi:hypothetical protein
VFYSPDGGHYRRSNFARRVFRPACDGRYQPVRGRPGSLVVVDATAWPGRPVASWPPTVPGKLFTPPSVRGTPHLVSTDGTGHCPSCGRAVKLRLDGKTVTHETGDQHCPGSGQQPSDDTPLACWLPVKDGLTPHGLRHGHKTWMAEGGIPEILAEQRLGHDVPGMRGLYAHASQRMREELLAALQPAGRNRCISAPALIRTPPFRCLTACSRRSALHRRRCRHAVTCGPREDQAEKMISQIPPKTATAPIRRVG